MNITIMNNITHSKFYEKLCENHLKNNKEGYPKMS